jgi:Ca-activated chloride channel family protein
MLPAYANIGKNEAEMTRGCGRQFGSTARRYPFYNCSPINVMIRRTQSRAGFLVLLLSLSVAALAQESGSSQPANPPSATQTQAPAQQPQTGQPPAQAPATQAPATQTQTPATQAPAKDPAATAPKGPVDSTYDEVHIKPRIDPDKPPPPKDTNAARDPNVPTPAELDPSLKTHTKPYKVEVDLVLIPVTITDPMNRLVTGLEKDNFVVMDNGQKQEIRHFSSEDAPISLGVIFDMSGSMKDKIEKSREAVVEFFKTANPQDEFFMVAFNEKPVLLSDFTQSIESIQGQLVYAEPKGRTALLDSIYLAISKMREAHNQKKALLIISDGGDNHSRYTESEIKSLVKEADVQIYGIGLYSSAPGTIEEQSGPATLSTITDVTGGRTFTVDNPNELADVATKIGIELRNQYVLGYRPTTPVKDGKWRKVKVKLNPPKGLPPLTVYAKSGYYAPSE